MQTSKKTFRVSTVEGDFVITIKATYKEASQRPTIKDRIAFLGKILTGPTVGERINRTYSNKGSDKKPCGCSGT